MLEEIIVAGSGGQGVLILGEVFAMASLYMGGKATWLPSYGPEMRGGTANCSVVISSKEIGSPVIDEPSILICFNQPSLNKFASYVPKGGIIFANDDAVEEYPQIEGVEIVKVKVNTLAREVGNERALNMVMLGAVLKKRPVIDVENASKALEHIWGPERTKKLLPLNLKAIESGMKAVS